MPKQILHQNEKEKLEKKIKDQNEKIHTEISEERLDETQQPQTKKEEAVEHVKEKEVEVVEEGIMISETFQKEIENVRRESFKKTVSKESINIKEALSKITVDLNNIEFVDKSPILLTKDISQVFRTKQETFQVVCTQSNYIAHMTALTLSDIDVVLNSSAGPYENRKLLYQIVHGHMSSTNVGKIGLTDWLKLTSYHDFPTLMFGIYCMTFPEFNDYKVTCPTCKKENKIRLDHMTLFDNTNQEKFQTILQKINEIVGIQNPLELTKTSMVHKSERIMLNESKAIVDIYTPSLEDHLQSLRMSTDDIIKKYSTAFGTTFFIKQIGVLDVDAYLKDQKVIYSKITNKREIFDIIRENMSINDGEQLSRAINNRIEKDQVVYKIKNQKCVFCNDSIGELDFDPESALFFVLMERRLV